MRLVRFRVNEVCTLKAKIFSSGLPLIVLLKLAFRTEGEIHICNSFQKVNNNETTHTGNERINIARAQYTAAILFDFPLFLRCLETRSSHLETQSVQASRREDRVSSFECQLTFKRYCRWAVSQKPKLI